MNFLSVFLRAVALLPSVVQGVETIYGAKAGARKRKAAISIVTAAASVAEAVGTRTIVDSAKFAQALGLVVDGVVGCLNASIWGKAAEG